MASSSTNPWERLPPVPDYVVPDDEHLVREFNRTAPPHLHLHLDLLPEPFLGSPSAPVVFLNLNPAVDERDSYHHKNDTFVERSRGNLVHRPSTYPFFLLAPEITAPGNIWWSQRFATLIKRYGLETVAQRAFAVEFLPYHSHGYGHDSLVSTLPSQTYSFSLVREAISRGALIVAMRKVSRWFDSVPELKGYSRLREKKPKTRSTHISPANFPDSFDEICTEFCR